MSWITEILGLDSSISIRVIITDLIHFIVGLYIIISVIKTAFQKT
jgi:hypothetical protein